MTALKIPKDKKMTGKICFLPSELTLTDCDMDDNIHEGFTIGKGKNIYWMMIWHPSGHVTVFHRDNPRYRRWIPGDTIVTVHFK